MKLYLTKTPRIIQQIFRNYTWRFASKKKEIYFTFDDGPTEHITNWTLDVLKQYNAKATFFCIGKNIENHQEIYTKIIEQGHSIGNHTHNHKNGLNTPTKEYIENTLLAEQLIQKAHQNLKLFRPPYGKIKKKQARKLQSLGYKIIMWDVLSADFDTSISKEKCLNNVLKNAKNGSIIVFHDSKKAAEKLQYALPKALSFFSEKGYEFKAIS